MTSLVPSKRKDWYYAPRSWLPDIGFAPTVQLVGEDKIEIHRSHLPILAARYPGVMDELYTRSGALMLDEIHMQREVFDAKLAQPLRGYQHVGREFIRSRRGTLLADQMRLGKSRSALSAHDPADGPLVIVAPLSTREVWKRECRAIFGAEPVILTGRSKVNTQLYKTEPSLFVHYDVAAAWQGVPFGVRLGTLIIDEAHNISSWKSKRSQAVTLLAQSADRVIGLSGTPLWNKVPGLWNILAAVVPGAFGSHYDFCQRYGDPVPGSHGWLYRGTSNTEEFQERMSEVMLRRMWRDVRAELPPTTRTVEVVDLTEKEIFKIDVAAEKARNTEKQTVRVAEIARLRRIIGLLKVDLAVERARAILAQGDPVIVWAWHRDVAEKIADAIILAGNTAWCVSGQVPAAKRDLVFKAWRESGPTAIVVTISVGQVGIDLSHAAHEIFAEVSFTPAEVAQAEMRPFSPLRPMFVDYLMVDHPIDRQVVTALVEKCASAEQLGVPAAESAIDMVAEAFGLVEKTGSAERLMAALLTAAADEGMVR